MHGAQSRLVIENFLSKFKGAGGVVSSGGTPV
jgi:hypothetical protein